MMKFGLRLEECLNQSLETFFTTSEEIIDMINSLQEFDPEIRVEKDMLGYVVYGEGMIFQAAKYIAKNPIS